MIFIHNEGVLKQTKKVTLTLIAMAFVAIISIAYLGVSSAAKPTVLSSGPGKVIVGTSASEWDSNTIPDPVNGVIPIGGKGQVNGEFTIAVRNGIQIGLRAQDRFKGTIDAENNKNNKVGIYSSKTSEATALWNYDWHVDLRGAKGLAKGTTISDYTLYLETDIANSLFGLPVPLDLNPGGFVPDNTILYQSSQNPTFGNNEFNPNTPGVYNFRLVLSPKTFNGPDLAVSIQVNVTEG